MNDDKFIPTSIHELDEILKTFIESPPLSRNIAYAIQYCQYLKHLIKNTTTTSVISTQLYKSYIICGMSIIEAILYALLAKNNQIKTEEWEEFEGKKTISIDSNTKAEIQIYKKSNSPKLKQLKFQTILTKSKKMDMFVEHTTLFEELNQLQKLRNKVHIYNIHTFESSDYNKFDIVNFRKMVEVLNKFILLLVNQYKKTK